MNKINLLYISLLFASIVMVCGNNSYADKRECKDLITSIEYDSEGHKDNPQSKKGFNKALSTDSLCEFTEKHDKEQIAGEVTSWDKLTNSQVWKSANEEQKSCLQEGYESPDDGHKAIQGYEIEYCGWDED